MKNRLFTLLLVGILLTGCSQKTENPPETETTTVSASEENTESETQEEEPFVLTFEANTVDGEALTSECFSQSKLTMLNVWATYCNPCLNEMPDLGTISTSYDTADFQVIGIISDVAEDAGDEDIKNAKDLIEQTGANYPHLLLNQSLYINLVGAIDSVPTTFFVNQNGEVLGYVIGAQSKENWEKIINDLLAENE